MLNYLLGDDLCITGSTHCTARRVVFKYGDKKQYQIDGEEAIDFDTIEQVQPVIALDDEKRTVFEQVRKVVTIYCPNELLKSGVEIIDLPGLCENQFLDNMVEELLNEVDIILYLFTLVSDLQSKDMHMIKLITEKRPDIDIMFVGTKLDFFERGVSGKRSHLLIEEDLDKFFNMLLAFYAKLGPSRQDSLYFHCISLSYSKQYEGNRERLVKGIIQVLQQQIEPLAQRTLDVLNYSLQTCLNLFRENVVEEQEVIEQVKSKYQLVLQNMKETVEQFIEAVVKEKIHEVYTLDGPKIVADISKRGNLYINSITKF